MQVQALGHVVLKVRDLQLAEVFYSRTLGMRVVLRIEEPRMTFFTLETPGSHHDFALMEIDAVASTPADGATGLAHVAFKIGSSAEEFRLARSVLETERTPVLYEAERKFDAECSRPRSGRKRDRAVRRRLRHLIRCSVLGLGGSCQSCTKRQRTRCCAAISSRTRATAPPSRLMTSCNRPWMAGERSRRADSSCVNSKVESTNRDNSRSDGSNVKTLQGKWKSLNDFNIRLRYPVYRSSCGASPMCEVSTCGRTQRSRFASEPVSTSLTRSSAAGPGSASARRTRRSRCTRARRPTGGPRPRPWAPASPLGRRWRSRCSG